MFLPTYEIKGGKFYEKLFCVFLALTMLIVLTVPAHADAVDELSHFEPFTPSGFSYYASIDRDAEFDVSIINTTLTLTGLIRGAGVVIAIIAISREIAENYDDDTLPVTYIDHIYEADHPEAEFGVPYVYWHKLEYTIELPDGSTCSRWSDYYEYAVAPR